MSMLTGSEDQPEFVVEHADNITFRPRRQYFKVRFLGENGHSLQGVQENSAVVLRTMVKLPLHTIGRKHFSLRQQSCRL